MTIGLRLWIIPDAYIPPAGTGDSRERTSHDTVCILSGGHRETQGRDHYFLCRPGTCRALLLFTVEAALTRHLRFNEFTDPEPVPHNTDYARSSHRMCPLSSPIRASIRASRRSR
jgi:hypothetical protein